MEIYGYYACFKCNTQVELTSNTKIVTKEGSCRTRWGKFPHWTCSECGTLNSVEEWPPEPIQAYI